MEPLAARSTEPPRGSAAGLSLRGIAKSFGRTRVLDGVDLEIRPGEFLTLVGPSGCGKSTLLRVIAGLEPQDAGSVVIGGRAVDELPPPERDVAMVFQSYALYPHMTVAANIASPLELRRLSLAERLPLLRLLSPRRRRVMREIMAEVRAMAAQLELTGLLDRRPSQLSGGQRQRVALGRAMVRRPAAFLMDEPLSNLDAKLRVHMRTELAELHARLGATFVYVTHDQVEAMTMSDRVALMEAGKILQLGSPAELYDTPADLTVARFIGSPPINLLTATAAPDGCVRIAGLALQAPAGGAVTVGIRPEALRIARAEAPGLLAARLRRAENLGAEWLLHAETAEGTPLAIRLTAAEHAAVAPIGERLALRAEPAGVHVFGADGRRLALRATAELAA
ncbi:ABC transporter ATP-binding protein [Falsiroseomonas sp.]|uniref:ABC transporter ATP-binding protein n=1 Tax=Falsiroseomonas sp. TaxID=2870721 RepID=UPI0035682B39